MIPIETKRAFCSTPQICIKSPSPLQLRRGNGEKIEVDADLSGFRRTASLDEIRAHDHVLVPGRYVRREESSGTPIHQRRR